MKLATRLLLALLLAGGIAAVVVNQNTAARLRSEHGELLKACEEIRRLKAENSEIQQLRAENAEVQKLLVSNKDLPRLRNEVRQLRKQAEEMEKLSVENQHLSVQMTRSIGENHAAPQLKGFIPRSSLADVGFSSPEATVQTVFWAICQGNAERLNECPIDPTQTPSQRELMNQFTQFPGFAITGKEQVSENEVIIQVQTSAGGPQWPCKLKRVGNDWKVVSF